MKSITVKSRQREEMIEITAEVERLLPFGEVKMKSEQGAVATWHTKNAMTIKTRSSSDSA